MIASTLKRCFFLVLSCFLTCMATIGAERPELSKRSGPSERAAEAMIPIDAEWICTLQANQKNLITRLDSLEKIISQIQAQIQSLQITTTHISRQTPLFAMWMHSDLPFTLSLFLGVSYLCVTGDVLSAMSMATGVYYCLQILAHYMVVFQRRS